MIFSSSHVLIWELDLKEGWAPKNWFFQTVVLEKTFESPLDSKEIKPVNPKGNQPFKSISWKDWCWNWSSNILATWCEKLTHLKRPWGWERLKVGEEDDRGWDGWMASPTGWTWVSELWELVMDREAWRAAIYGVAKNRTLLSDWTEPRPQELGASAAESL